MKSKGWELTGPYYRRDTSTFKYYRGVRAFGVNFMGLRGIGWCFALPKETAEKTMKRRPDTWLSNDKESVYRIAAGTKLSDFMPLFVESYRRLETGRWSPTGGGRD